MLTPFWEPHSIAQSLVPGVETKQNSVSTIHCILQMQDMRLWTDYFHHTPGTSIKLLCKQDHW